MCCSKRSAKPSITTASTCVIDRDGRDRLSFSDGLKRVGELPADLARGRRPGRRRHPSARTARRLRGPQVPGFDHIGSFPELVGGAGESHSAPA